MLMTGIFNHDMVVQYADDEFEMFVPLVEGFEDDRPEVKVEKCLCYSVDRFSDIATFCKLLPKNCSSVKLYKYKLKYYMFVTLQESSKDAPSKPADLFCENLGTEVRSNRYTMIFEHGELIHENILSTGVFV